jgi:hypothetical protein
MPFCSSTQLKTFSIALNDFNILIIAGLILMCKRLLELEPVGFLHKTMSLLTHYNYYYEEQQQYNFFMLFNPTQFLRKRRQDFAFIV